MGPQEGQSCLSPVCAQMGGGSRPFLLQGTWRAVPSGCGSAPHPSAGVVWHVPSMCSPPGHLRGGNLVNRGRICRTLCIRFPGKQRGMHGQGYSTSSEPLPVRDSPQLPWCHSIFIEMKPELSGGLLVGIQKFLFIMLCITTSKIYLHPEQKKMFHKRTGWRWRNQGSKAAQE